MLTLIVNSVQYVKNYYLHFPIEHKDTGSPTTATKDCARVIAVFSSFTLDRKP